MIVEASLPIAAPEAESRRLFLSAAGLSFALRLATVREVIPAPACTRIPGAPRCVRGLFNLRGRILTVVDLADALALDGPRGADPRLIVMRHGDLDVGLIVDELLRITAADEVTDLTFELIDDAALFGPIFGRPEDR